MKTIEQKRTEAKLRTKQRAGRTNKAQLVKLDKGSYRAVRERARLG